MKGFSKLKSKHLLGTPPLERGAVDRLPQPQVGLKIAARLFSRGYNEYLRSVLKNSVAKASVRCMPHTLSYYIRNVLFTTISAAVISSSGARAIGATTASDAALNAAYAADATGAWKGLNPTADENPPGTDNGGSGFNTWDFFGGFHQPQYSPYGRLNHFIAGVDFPTTSFNNLGSRAFALTNSNFDPAACGTSCGFGGETARATRPFASAMAPGDTFSIDFDNPHLFPEVAWYPAGFLIRLDTGHGPAVPGDPTSSGTERFGIFGATGVYGQSGEFGANWAVADSAGNTNTGVDVSATSSGAKLQFTLETDETYSMAVKRLSDGAVLFSQSGSLSSTGAGPIDTVEIVLYGNGSGNGLVGPSMQATGEREFYFNNLRIDSAGLAGDYNHNGVVDADDYVLWRRTMGQSVTPGAGADGDGDGMITQADYNIWRAHYGLASTTGLSQATVPEPSEASLVAESLVAILMVTLSSRRNGDGIRSCGG